VEALHPSTAEDTASIARNVIRGSRRNRDHHLNQAYWCVLTPIHKRARPAQTAPSNPKEASIVSTLDSGNQLLVPWDNTSFDLEQGLCDGGGGVWPDAMEE
jgi:hypothetical protein